MTRGSAVLLGFVWTVAAFAATVVQTAHPARDVVVAEDVFAATTDTDCSAALQARLDAVGARGGGTVFLPVGAYTLAKPIEIPVGVVLRGDFCAKAPAKGTVLRLVGGRGDEKGPAAVTVNPGAGVVGLVFWYPDQRLENPVPYPWTIRTKIHPSCANDNQTVADCMIVNAWRGISIGPEWNELHTFRNLSICALATGFAVDSTTDIGRVSDVVVSPRAWSASGFPGAPDETELRAWLRAHDTVGADYGRSDWEYIWRLKVDGYRTGVRFRRGQRGLTNAVMADSDLANCGTGLFLDALNGVGLAVYDCRFASAENVGFASNFNSVAQFSSCAFAGTVPAADGRHVIVTPARQPAIRPEPMTWPRPSTDCLADVAQFGAATNCADNTAAFQRALDSLAAGGGTVYVPAGLWRFQGSLRVPTGVELRGSSDVPHHTVSGGSVLLPLAGKGDADGTPFILLAERSGARGLCVWYCEQPVNEPVAYPWTVRSLGPGCWLTDVNIANCWQGVDFAAYPSAGHRISYLSGAFWRRGLVVGRSAVRGWVEDTQFNPHYVQRLPKGLPVVRGVARRAKSNHGGTQSDTMREFLHGLVFRDCADEQIRGTFLFAAREGIAFRGRNKVELLMHGTDTGTTGFVVDQSAGGVVRAALAQLVPWANDFGAESAAILLPKTDAGASTFLASQFWVDFPTLVQHGAGSSTLETFNSLSGAVRVDNGRVEVRDGVFARGGRAHVCVSNGTARVADCACLTGALKVWDPCRRAAVSGSSGDSLSKDLKLPDAPPRNLRLAAPFMENAISPKGGIRKVSAWSCTASNGVLRLTGHSDDPSYSYLYCDVARPSVPVYPDTVLKYRFKPLNKMSRIAAIDLAFSDGTVLRMLGVGMHPGERMSEVGMWCDCAVPLGKVAGKTVSHVMLKWDSRRGGGVFDACFADIRFETPNPRENWTLTPVVKGGVVSFDPPYPHRVWYTLDGHSVDAAAKTFVGSLRLPAGAREFRYSPSLCDGTPSQLEFVLHLPADR